MSAMIQRTDQPHNRVCGLPPVDRRRPRRPIAAAEPLGGRGRLAHRRERARGQPVDQQRETVDRRCEAFGIERISGFSGIDLETALQQHVAAIDRGCHPVPADPMVPFAAQQRPHRRVHARTLRQRSVVKVDCGSRRQIQHRRGQDRQIGDAEQMGERSHGPCHQRRDIIQNHNTARNRPVAQRRPPADDGADGMAPRDQHRGTFDQQRLVTDEDAAPARCTGQRGHERTPRAAGRRDASLCGTIVASGTKTGVASP